ncbi:MAG TPA: serine hydrolase [Nitriliruptorales bacterium]
MAAVEQAQGSWPVADWPRSTPEDEGIDGAALEAIEDAHETDHPWLDALVVVRHGRLVWERYHNGYDRDTPHQCKSCTKSMLSTLVGIALERGVLPSLDVPIRGYLTEYLVDGVDPRKGDITIGDALRMRSGLDWFENDERTGRWIASADPIAFTFASDEQPVVAPPGERWRYSTADSQLVGECLARAAGRALTELAREWLLDPIGAKGWYWPSEVGKPWGWEREPAGSELHLRPVDHARLGLLTLRGGEWDGRSIVSRGWLDLATSGQEGLDVCEVRREEERHPAWELLPRYGLHWWRGTFGGRDTIAAVGYGGQFCFIVPALDLVVVHHSSIVYERELQEAIAAAREDGRLDENDQPVGDEARRFFAELGERMVAGRAAREIPDGIAGGLTLMDQVIVPAVDM